jgi:hypothetical protein
MSVLHAGGLLADWSPIGVTDFASCLVSIAYRRECLLGKLAVSYVASEQALDLIWTLRLRPEQAALERSLSENQAFGTLRTAPERPKCA